MIRLPTMMYFVKNINCISFAIFPVFPTFPQNLLSISEPERYLEHFENRNFILRCVRGRYSSTKKGFGRVYLRVIIALNTLKEMLSATFSERH